MVIKYEHTFNHIQTILKAFKKYNIEITVVLDKF
ncbi:MAG: hypothetical protein AVDCRST_MAG96-3837 [uncultured Segetibacter sp.]|uniref:Uncharacterized protein n=1 Tax=uncultured Segetibacter sp. TaxID=481133 RepID=A0A6J4TZP4_9BACT|nr:MAG: hypothetical protein AVDCRST_MAG96-3837 [uncultured Segetibacter sp.]